MGISGRIQAHLIIKDYPGAIQEATAALRIHPASVPIHEGYLRALAKSGDERRCGAAWRAYVRCFPERAISNRELIEEIAWGVLQKASHSPSIVMREMALLAAFFSRDAKGVALLSQGMSDPNYAVRAVAVKLSGHFRDRKLIAEVQRLFREERVWTVRRQLIEAMGTMGADCFRSDLEALIASDESSREEKALAIAALLELLDEMPRIEVERLSLSMHAGLRQFACRAIAHFRSLRDLDRLLGLANDAQADVRAAAYQSIGQLRPRRGVEAVVATARLGVRDLRYEVSLSAAWLLTLYEPEEGRRVLDFMLQDPRWEVRALASAVVAATGAYGAPLAVVQFREHQDPCVRLNLALGLIGQRMGVEECAAYLKSTAVESKERWKPWKEGIFCAVVHRSPKGREGSLIAPESEDQLLRLEWLRLLLLLEVPGIQENIPCYLSERSWEISATAATLLLGDGDEAASESVRQLLHDSSPRIRLQAALILSIWSREEEPLKILEESYAGSPWELKSRILEALGRVGSLDSVPFLIEALQEPSQTLRLIAAMALIQCLNH